MDGGSGIEQLNSQVLTLQISSRVETAESTSLKEGGEDDRNRVAKWSEMSAGLMMTMMRVKRKESRVEAFLKRKNHFLISNEG